MVRSGRSGRLCLRAARDRSACRRRHADGAVPAWHRNAPPTDRHAHSRRASWRNGRDRVGADHRRARRHQRRDQQRLQEFRVVSHPVDLGPAHGDHGGRALLFRSTAPRRDSVFCFTAADQKDCRCDRNSRRAGLSRHLGGRVRDGPLGVDDPHHLRRGADRSSGDGAQKHRARRILDSRRLSRKPPRRGLPDVVRGRDGARRGA